MRRGQRLAAVAVAVALATLGLGRGAVAQPAPAGARMVPFHRPVSEMRPPGPAAPSPAPAASPVAPAPARPLPLHPPAPAVPGGPRYVIEVLTFGPGGHPFTRFGHDAIRVVDRVTRTDRVYNFGTFSSEAPHLITDFLRGRLRYWLSVAPTRPTLEDYRLDDRGIEAQGLALSDAQAAALVDRLEVNARPENRAYKYDYFRDNCATRVRDALDAVTGGAVREAGARPARQTLRAQALRMAADDLPFYLALSIVLGPATDRPIDAWAEDFLPQSLQRTLRLVRLSDRNGPARPLVANERVVFESRRLPPRAAPPRWGWRFFGAGVGVGLLFLALGRLGRRRAVARVPLGALLSIGGAAMGFLGTFLLGAWLFTPHAAVYRNQNILLFAPFALALAPLGVGVALGWAGAIRKAFFVCAAALALAALAVVIKPFAHQDNAALLAFVVPVWLGMSLGTRALLSAVGGDRTREGERASGLG